MNTNTIDLKENETPVYDLTDNPTNCCPRFVPAEWDDRELHFSDKLFVKAKTRALMHIPLNMGSVFKKTFAAIEEAGADESSQPLVLSRDLSAWSAEHLFAVTKNVPGQEMTRLSGDFHTKVFEGPFRNAGIWCEELKKIGDCLDNGSPETYLFYTTCPGCAKHYGKNYVVGFVRTNGST